MLHILYPTCRLSLPQDIYPLRPLRATYRNRLSRVPILTSHANYQAWFLELKSTGHIATLWKTLSGSDTLSLTATDEEKAARETRLERALGLVTKTVSPNLKVYLRYVDPKHTSATPHEATASEMMVYLKDKFEKVNGISAIIDFGTINRARLVDDGTHEAQLNAFQDLRSRYALYGFKYEDCQYALILLALPDTYGHVKDAFLATSTSQTLKPDEIYARISDTERRRKAEVDPTANVLASKPNAPAKGGKGKGRRTSNVLRTIDPVTVAERLGIGRVSVAAKRTTTTRLSVPLKTGSGTLVPPITQSHVTFRI